MSVFRAKSGDAKEMILDGLQLALSMRELRANALFVMAGLLHLHISGPDKKKPETVSVAGSVIVICHTLRSI